ncbi:MAG: GMC family oxidoreductase [Stellaceae bacterium]
MRRMAEFDYIIVGAGSAGCVLANRLSAERDVSVLLLEAGGEARALALKIPLYAPKLWFGHQYGWGYDGEVEPHLGGRFIPVPRGKVLGGSSAINGMLYARGHPRDYDQWRQLGNAGWSYPDILPYYRRAETDWRGEGVYHGGTGPLKVSRHDRRYKMYDLVRAAAREAGHPETEDFHGASPEGFGVPDFTTIGGRRGSTAVTFLKPARGRPNLRVMTHAQAMRVMMEKGRAVGVEYRRDGALAVARARREVILCGGAINSPHLLMLSGIGPAEELRRHGITPLLDLSGVGRNLQDHASTGIDVVLNRPVSFVNQLRADRVARSLARWWFTGTGPLAGLPVTGMLFARSRDGLERPDLQFLISPVRLFANLWFPVWRKADGHFLSIRAVLLHPESRGWIGLRSADPLAKPRITFNLLDRPEDLPPLRAAIRMSRDLVRHGALAGLVDREASPGDPLVTDEQLDDFIRSDVRTAFHAVGTCRMGQGADAVVDERLQVRGIEGLRVVDASVMPTIIGGNTNAPTIMIAEKASDMILGRPPLEPAEI